MFVGVIIGLAGAIGSGKSWTMLHQMLVYAEQRQKQLVFNFNVDVSALRTYAASPKWHDSELALLYKFFHNFLKQGKSIKYHYPLLAPLHRFLSFPLRFLLWLVGASSTAPKLPWILHLCDLGGVICIPSPDRLEALLIPESVVGLDEAGIFLNSREFASTSKQLLADLCQSRKDGCDLFWAAQFEEQVDKQVRLLTQFWIHCDSVSTYDKRSRRPKLLIKNIFWFKAADYFEWLRSKDRTSHFKTLFVYSFSHLGGFLTASDKQLFSVFNSFNRLEVKRESAPIVTRERCLLQRGYYFERLPTYYPCLDPLNVDIYQPLYGYYFKLRSKSPSRAGSESSPSAGGRSSLIRQALQSAKAAGVTPPFFKSMPDHKIKSFIESL